MTLKWSKQCCLCGEEKTSYHNPDPVRDGNQDCCSECNQIVCRARMKCSKLTGAEREAYLLRLRGMSYDELVNEFVAEEGGREAFRGLCD